MPKVLRIINRFNLGGPSYNAAYLTKYLSPDYETLLIGGLKEEGEESSEFIFDNLGINYSIIPEMHRSIKRFDEITAYNKIKSIIKDFKPDIVHTHAAKAGALGRWAAHSMNVPIIIHTYHGHVFHSYFNKYKTEVFKFIERELAKRSTKIIAISDIQKYELSEIHKICDASKFEVIPLGFDLSRFQENKELKRKQFRNDYLVDDDEIAIGIIGRLAPIKNHNLFLKSLKSIEKKTSKKIRAFIIGDGDDKLNIQNKLNELNLKYTDYTVDKKKALVTLTSWIKNVDYAMAGLDIIALTSLNEGTPVSLIEAQASGRAIVSTNVGGIENVVIANKTALLSEVNNEKELTDNMLRLIEDDELRNELSKNGWEFVRQKFHYTRLINDMRKLYDKLYWQLSITK